jgi:hypothetical protein
MKSNPKQTAVLPELTGPEYIRVPQVTSMFGISRSHLFILIGNGTVESIHMKRPGAQKGVRLIKVASVREYLNSFAKH